VRSPKTVEERYGAIGKGFIEAHHLRPIATLQEGVAAADSAVLCANFHRIIVICRSGDPSSLAQFRTSLMSNKS
jgi:5-methylcytosine-specific restriction enzyme A